GHVSVGTATATPTLGTGTITPTATPPPTVTSGPTDVATATGTPTVTATPLPVKGALSFELPNSIAGQSTFTVNVKAALNADVLSRGMQFGLSFDQTKVNITRVDLGPLYKDWANGHSAQAQLATPFKVDNAKGTTSIGVITVTNQTQ